MNLATNPRLRIGLLKGMITKIAATASMKKLADFAKKSKMLNRMLNDVRLKPILLLSTGQRRTLRELNLVTNLLKRSLNVLKPSAIVLKMHLTPCKPSILVSKKSSKGNSYYA